MIRYRNLQIINITIDGLEHVGKIRCDVQHILKNKVKFLWTIAQVKFKNFQSVLKWTFMLCLVSPSQSSLLAEFPRNRLGRISTGKSCCEMWYPRVVWTSSKSDDDPEDVLSSDVNPPDILNDLKNQNVNLY